VVESEEQGESDASSDGRRGGLRSAGSVREVWWRELLVILGLTGFAISQPMLSLLGENPTVFTFHGVDGPLLVVFALGLALLPPLVLWGVGLGVTAIDRRAGRLVHLVTAAVLVALTVIQIVKALGLEQEAAVAALGVAGGVGLAWAYNRFDPVATWLQFTAILPAFALFLFLFASPTSDLVGGREGVTAPADERNDLPPVVMIVLDEFPTASILDADDNVDAVRFPHLARFAEDATWYRHYTSVAPSTQYAVPAMLTGNPPGEDRPLWTNYPDNLFTMLAPTHDLVSFETATELCGLETCTEGPPGTSTRTTDLGELVSATGDLFRERVSPAPNRGEQLDTFEEELLVEPVGADSTTSTTTSEAQPGPFSTANVTTRLGRVERFVDSLAPRNERPAFFFLHLMLPHSPWRFYETGEPYDAVPAKGAYPFTAHNDEGDWVAAVTEQRHLLQAQYTDQVVGDLLDELQARELYDESLVIVVADHGITFDLDVPERSLAEDSLDGIGGLAYSPLFIKPPGQTEGSIDDSNLQAIDVVPTIASLLDIEVPYEVRGKAAGSKGIDRRGDEKIFYDLIGPIGDKTLRGVVEYPDDYLPTAADRWIPPIGPDDDPMAGLYEAFGLSDLIGRPLDPMITDGGGVAQIPTLGALRATGDGAVPLGAVLGRVVLPEDADGVVVAAIDDTIVAASPLHDFDGEARKFTLLFPPGVVGTGEVRMALVSGDRVTELELTS
jgi:hypothetical protein